MTGLRPGQGVLLRPEATSALAARVDLVGEDAVVLVLVTPPLRPLPVGATCEVETATSDGDIASAAVRIVACDGRGSVRVAPLGAQPAVVQRREFLRVKAVIPVVVRHGGVGAAHRDALTADVSGGGLLLTGVSALSCGDAAWLQIELADGAAPVEALGTVVREEADGRRAVRLDSLAARDEQRLVRLAFAHQQRARTVREA
jgi:c-di-GMP-binding flagellar brake protein YcgR